MTAPRIEIVIDELVLRGVAAEHADAVAAALQTRLVALARDADCTIAPPAATERRLAVAGVPSDRPSALGAAAADRVHAAVFGDAR